MIRNIALAICACFISLVEAKADGLPKVSFRSKQESKIVLVILEGTVTSTLPIAKISTSRKKPTQLQLKITGPATFTSERKKLVTNSDGIVSLPPIEPGQFNSTSELDFFLRGKKVLRISVFSTSQTLFDQIETDKDVSEGAIINRGPTWYLVNINKLFEQPMSGETNSLRSSTTPPITYPPSSYLAFSESYEDPEKGGKQIGTTSSCSRFWHPITAYTGGDIFSSVGVQLWKIKNQISAGFSLKNESNDRLRCPNRDSNAIESNVDGLYKRSWKSTVWKVPGHCTSTRSSGINNCCCNSSLAPFAGKCRYGNTNTSEFDGWPKIPLMCR